MRSILITGGAGYIGNVICNLSLQKGYTVKAVDILWFNNEVPLINFTDPRYKFTKGDICDDGLLESLLGGVDYVIHTAGVVGDPACKKFPEIARKVNYDASINLINRAKLAGVKGLIFFSTCSNYGISDGIANEETTLKPLSPYSEAKVEIERYLMDDVKDLDWSICRLSTVYGASSRMRFDLTVNDFTLNAYINHYLDIFMPYTYRPYIHVFDVANVIVNIIESFDKAKNNVFNVGFDGENYQKIQIAEAVREYIPDVKIEVVDKGKDARDYQVDFSKLGEILDIKKTHTLRDGVKEIISLLEMGLINDPKDNVYYNTLPNLGE
jgi:nucleoside-diphosphate-sugar epimerase